MSCAVLVQAAFGGDAPRVTLELLTGSVVRGHPLAQPYRYMNRTTEAHVEPVEKHCRIQELVDSVGIPILIHRDDLAVVAPLWPACMKASAWRKIEPRRMVAEHRSQEARG